MAPEAAPSAAVKRTIHVSVPIEKAFRVFTERMAAWWPATHHIAKEPFARQADGGMRGPAWAVELQAARLRVDELLIASAVNPIQLYESTTAFVDAAERHMYLADKQLRDSAAKLYDLSEVVLGQLGHG